jgi:hypothetical protein
MASRILRSFSWKSQSALANSAAAAAAENVATAKGAASGGLEPIRIARPDSPFPGVHDMPALPSQLPASPLKRRGILTNLNGEPGGLNGSGGGLQRARKRRVGLRGRALPARMSTAFSRRANVPC